MADEKSNNQQSRRKRRWPIKIMIFTVIVVAVVLGLRMSADTLNERFNMSLDELNLITMISGFLIFIVWAFWWFFLSGFNRLLRFATFLLLIGFGFFMSRYVRVVPGGDVNPRRIEFAFWNKTLPTEDLRSIVDLSATSATDFPEFRGTGRSGIVLNTRLKEWSNDQPEELWKQPIGRGWSGFTVVNGYAVTMEQRQEFECVTCYDLKTGELKWIHKGERRHADQPGLGGIGPRATPTIHQGKVYAQGATGVLECLDGKDGSLLWSVNVTELLSVQQHEGTDIEGYEYNYEDNTLAWGRSGSPLIYENKVIVTGGGPKDGPYVTLLAFDKDSGAELWRGGDQMIGYGSPSVGTLLGKEQILIVAESMVSGHDPETGKVLWQHVRPGGSSSSANCSQVTIVSDSQVLLSKGYRTGGELLDISKAGEEFSAKRSWKSTRVLKTKFNSPVLKDGYAYSLSSGYLECTEVATGKKKWTEQPVPENENDRKERFDHGQLLLVGDHLVINSESGVLYLVEASPEEYRQVGRKKSISGVCWNNLCISGEYLLVRSDLEAACYRLPLESSVASESETDVSNEKTPSDE